MWHFLTTTYLRHFWQQTQNMYHKLNAIHYKYKHYKWQSLNTQKTMVWISFICFFIPNFSLSMILLNFAENLKSISESLWQIKSLIPKFYHCITTLNYYCYLQFSQALDSLSLEGEQTPGVKIKMIAI